MSPARLRWAVAGIVSVQVLSLVLLLRGTFFFLDDYLDLQIARDEGLSVDYVQRSLFGHLEPGNRVVNWVLEAGFGGSHRVTAVLTIVSMAVATVLLWRLMVLVAGPSPWLLAPLAWFAFAACAPEALLWWSAAIQVLPATVGGIVTVDASVRWWRFGRQPRHLILATLALTLALSLYETVSYLPLAIALLILGWCSTGTLRERVTVLVRRGWPLGAAFAVPIVAYWSWYAHLGYSREVSSHTSPGRLAAYLGHALSEAYVPLLLGIAPHDWSIGSSTATCVAAAIVVAALVVVTVRRSRETWRGWVALALLFVLSAVPVGLARAGTFGAAYGSQTRYFAASTWLVALALALIVVPITRPRATPRPVSQRRLTAAAVAVLTLVWAVGSVQAMRVQRRHSPALTAGRTQAVLQASWAEWHAREPQAGIYDTTIPGVADYPPSAGLYPYTQLSRSAGTYLPGARFDTGSPMLVVQRGGRLVEARFEVAGSATGRPVADGTASFSAGAGIGCVDGGESGGTVVWPLDRPVDSGTWFAQLTTAASQQAATLRLLIGSGGDVGNGSEISRHGDFIDQLVPAGAHDTTVLLAPRAGIDAVGIQVPRSSHVCLTRLVVGQPVASG